MTSEPVTRPGRVMSVSQRSAEAIATALAGAGTRLLFGVPGGGPNLDLVGAAADAGLSFVLAHGETAATIMAATCADLTGAPGAVVVTRGPGLASAVNGIAHATLDRLPLIVIADTVPARDRGRVSHQRLDQAALARSVAKAAVTAGAAQAGHAAGLAIRLARAAPAGPVVINVDPGAGTAPGEIDEAGAHTSGRPAGQMLAPLAAALRTARRPVVLLGTGALPHTAAVRAALVGSGIPALHTYRARGIVQDSAAEAAGLVTGGTTEWRLLAAADLIIGLGVDPAEMIPATWDYAALTILVSENGAAPDRPADFTSTGPDGPARYFTGATELAAPLPAAIGLLAAHRHGHDWPPATGRAARTDTSARLRAVASAAPGLLSPQDVVTTIRGHTPPETIATVDAGAHMLVTMPLWEVDEPHRLLISSGLATMGYALPAAIAAALCVPAAPVVAFTGDGGLGMTLMEIETAVRLGLRIVVVVFNDATLSLIRIKQRPVGHGGRDAVGYGPASFAAAATALGAFGAMVSDVAELASAVAAALGRAGPTVIDARVDPASYPAVMELTRGETGRRGLPELRRPARPAHPARPIPIHEDSPPWQHPR